MPDTSRIERKMKRLSAVEAEYRTAMKRAEAEVRRDPERKQRHLREISKYEKKIEKLLPKIRRLREIRTRMRSRA